MKMELFLVSLSIEDLQQQNATLSAENLFLKEQLEWFKRQIFGKKIRACYWSQSRPTPV